MSVRIYCTVLFLWGTCLGVVQEASAELESKRVAALPVHVTEVQNPNAELESLKYLLKEGYHVELEGDIFIEEEKWEDWKCLPQRDGKICHVIDFICSERVIDSSLVNHLKNFQHLKSIVLFNCEIKESSGFDLGNWPQLSDFLFWNSQKGAPQILFRSFASSSIQEMEIAGIFTDEDWKCIAKTPNLRQLRTTIRGAEEIQLLVPLKETLQYLDVSCVKVDRKAIPILKEFSNLRTLYITSSQIDIDFVKGLNEVPIERLMLYGPQMTDEFLTILAEHKTLKVISLPIEQTGWTWPKGVTKEGLEKFKATHNLKVCTGEECLGWSYRDLEK